MKNTMRGASGAALLAALAGVAPAWSQQAQTVQTAPQAPASQAPSATDQTAPPVEEQADPGSRVVVTGQLIAGATEDAPLPVETFSMEDLQDQGVPTAAEFLRALNISSEASGASDGTIAGAAAGFANVNLRGLGTGRTMVLLNGRRFMESGTFGADINTLPMMAVGRVDILKDGASVTYGAGAVGGVINYITRRDLDGFEVEGDKKFYADSDGEENIQLLWGKSYDASNMLFGVSYTNQHDLRTMDRDFAVLPYKLLPGAYLPTAANPSDYYTFDPATGSIRNQFRDYTLAQCQALGGDRLGNLNTSVAATSQNNCAVRQQPFYNLVEDMTYLRGYFEFNSDISDNLEFHAEVQYAKTDTPHFASTPSLANGQKRATETNPANTGYTSQVIGYFTVPYTQTLYNAQGVATGVSAPNPYSVEFFNRASANGTAFGANNVAAGTFVRGDLLTTDAWRPVFSGGNPLYPDNLRYEASLRERWGGSLQLKGKFAEDGLFGRFLPPDTTFDYSTSYSLYSNVIQRSDYAISRMENALRGYGGPSCNAVDRVPTVIGRIPDRSEFAAGAAGTTAFNNAVAAVRYAYDQSVGIQSDTLPGTNGCLYFNPFASSFQTNKLTGAANTAYGGASFQNDPALMRWLVQDRFVDNRAEALTVEATYTGVVPWFELPGGEIGWAVGSQWRMTETRVLPLGSTEDLQFLSQRCAWGDQGLPGNFVGQSACNAISGPYYGSGIGRVLTQSSDRQVISFYGEAQIPLLENLNIQAAVRREEFQAVTGDIWKVAAKYDPLDWLSFRASYSTNFQAPPDSITSVGPQVSGVYTASLLRTVPTTLNTLAGITPEEDKGSNIGVIFAPELFDGQLRASVDFWEFTIDKEIANTTLAVVLSSVFGTAAPIATTAANCSAAFVKFVTFQDNVCNQGSTTANQITNILQYQLNTGGFFENGLDFKADYTHAFGPGDITVGFDATQVMHYKVKGYSVPDPVSGAAIPYLQSFNGIGSTNFTRAGTVMPEWRSNAFVRYSMENHTFNLRWNFVSGVQDDNVLFKTGGGSNNANEAGCTNPKSTAPGNCIAINSDDTFATYGYYPKDWENFDFTYVYTPSFIDDLEFRLSVMNVLNKNPMPAANANSGGIGASAQNRVGYLNGFGDPRLRQIEIGITKKF
jgi:iron complex outermembrane recepter protein